MKEPSSRGIGQRLRAARQQQHLSEQELAVGICSADTLRKVEAGLRFPTVDLIEKFAARLHLSPEDLLEPGGSPPLTDNDLQALPPDMRIDFLLLHADGLIERERRDEAISFLQARIDDLSLRREEDRLPLAKLYICLGTAFEKKGDDTEAYSSYMQAYLISDKSVSSDKHGIRDRAMWRAGLAADRMGGARAWADQLFQLSEEVDGDHRAKYPYLFQARALYEYANLQEMRLEVTQVLEEVRNQDPIESLHEMLATVDRSAMTELEHIRLMNAYANAAQQMLRDERRQETGDYLRHAADLLAALGKPEMITVSYFRTQACYHLDCREYEIALAHALTACKRFEELEDAEEAADAWELAADVHAAMNDDVQALACRKKAREWLSHV